MTKTCTHIEHIIDFHFHLARISQGIDKTDPSSVGSVALTLQGVSRTICMICTKGILPGFDLYGTNPARHLRTAGEHLDDLPVDRSRSEPKPIVSQELSGYIYIHTMVYIRGTPYKIHQVPGYTHLGPQLAILRVRANLRRLG